MSSLETKRVFGEDYLKLTGERQLFWVNCRPFPYLRGWMSLEPHQRSAAGDASRGHPGNDERLRQPGERCSQRRKLENCKTGNQSVTDQK
jgi:hypothetical protein